MVQHSFVFAFVFFVGGLASFVVQAISVEQDLSLTLQQKNTLDKFRIRVGSKLTKTYMKTDLYLIRWLRARNFDLNAAERMLNQNLRWRRENRMDSILLEDFSEMKKEFPAAVDTYDRENRPIGTIDIFEWDLRRAVLQGKGPRVLRYLYHFLENATMQVFERQAKGMNVTQWVALGGADGFNVVQHACPACIPYWVQYVQTIENHYNGWMHEFIIIDAPSTIGVLLEAVRPFLSPQTSETFRIFNANRAKWLPFLDERIARDQRRVQYGGTLPPLSF